MRSLFHVRCDLLYFFFVCITLTSPIFVTGSFNNLLDRQTSGQRSFLPRLSTEPPILDASLFFFISLLVDASALTIFFVRLCQLLATIVPLPLGESLSRALSEPQMVHTRVTLIRRTTLADPASVAPFYTLNEVVTDSQPSLYSKPWSALSKVSEWLWGTRQSFCSEQARTGLDGPADFGLGRLLDPIGD